MEDSFVRERLLYAGCRVWIAVETWAVGTLQVMQSFGVSCGDLTNEAMKLVRFCRNRLVFDRDHSVYGVHRYVWRTDGENDMVCYRAHSVWHMPFNFVCLSRPCRIDLAAVGYGPLPPQDDEQMIAGMCVWNEAISG